MKEFDHEWKHKFSICHRFKARIKFINNDRHKPSQGHQISVYVGNVKQTCSITSVEQTTLDTFTIGLKLTKRPEYIRKDSRIIIRHTLTIGIGRVCAIAQLFDDECNE